MVRFPKVFLGLFIAVGLTLVGCNGSTPNDVAESPSTSLEAPTVETEDGDAPSDNRDEAAEGSEDSPVEVQVNGPEGAGEDTEMIAVSIYVMDDSCSAFQAESVEVPASEAMTEAIGELLDRHSFESFKLSGYRVNVEDSKAIVDLRLAEDSERQFLSLSSCEQQGLFGGVEETLMQNPTWQVNQVEFTNRGQEIVL